MAASTDAVMADIVDDRAHLGSLPNELLNLITDLVVAGGTPMAVMRLMNKRFKACAQSHLVESLQAKVCTSPASTQGQAAPGAECRLVRSAQLTLISYHRLGIFVVPMIFVR